MFLVTFWLLCEVESLRYCYSILLCLEILDTDIISAQDKQINVYYIVINKLFFFVSDKFM